MFKYLLQIWFLAFLIIQSVIVIDWTIKQSLIVLYLIRNDKELLHNLEEELNFKIWNNLMINTQSQKIFRAVVLFNIVSIWPIQPVVSNNGRRPPFIFQNLSHIWFNLVDTRRESLVQEDHRKGKYRQHVVSVLDGGLKSTSHSDF